MTSSRFVSMALLAACAASGALAQPPQQLRGNSRGATGQMLFRIANSASFPVTLVNCAANFTVAAYHAETQTYASFAALANTSFFWVVPKGETVDCDSGCPDCFYVAFGLEAGGGLVTRLGFETNDNDDAPFEEFANNKTSGPDEVASASDAPHATVTGLKLVVSRMSDGVRQSAACGPSSCSPDWERDHAVAWDTTIDLVVTGLSDSDMGGTVTPTDFGLGLLRPRRVVRRTTRRVVRRTVVRPPVWRRPIWRRPIYPAPYCCYCNSVCYWLCR